uniref:NADH-ubiquinone oxidoreductase chain 6 n=1 Tax=Protochauliodes humeralis TaxID=2900188 RepID=A0A8K1ZAD4_9NEOP|nr:NADH dehydrogenase subunit 6 [Protochauliodes humeralis]
MSDIKLFLLMSNILMNWNFMQSNHPLAMGLILLIQTIMISMISGMIMKTYWFSYILFLIMLGGMLVLFIYMTSLASNEKFQFSMINLVLNFIIIMMMIIIYLMNMNIFPEILNSEMNLWNFINLIPENKLDLLKPYNFPMMNLIFMLVNYLFLTLIISVKITNINYGPLRQMN